MNFTVYLCLSPSLQGSANIYCTAALYSLTCQHVSKSSTPLSCAPLCGLCQSVCAAVMLPTCIMLESRVVAGLEATVLVWIWGWILTPQGLYGTTGPLTRRQWQWQHFVNKVTQSKNKVSIYYFKKEEETHKSKSQCYFTCFTGGNITGLKVLNISTT